jgi:hypothetical protein
MTICKECDNRHPQSFCNIAPPKILCGLVSYVNAKTLLFNNPSFLKYDVYNYKEKSRLTYMYFSIFLIVKYKKETEKETERSIVFIL